MKKFLLFALFIFSVGNLSAQLNESFDGEVFPPEGWTTTCHPSTSAKYPQWSSTADINAYIPGFSHGGKAALATGGFGKGVVNDSWLITPQIAVEQGQYLHFMLGANWANNVPAANRAFDVVVSRSDTARVNFTDTLMSISPEGVLPWGAYVFDLYEYAGNDIYIGFHERGTGTTFLMTTNFTYIDNVVIDGNAGADLCVRAISGLVKGCDTEQLITATVVNTGIQVNEYRMNFQVGSSAIISEKVTAPLSYGEQTQYTFTRPATLEAGNNSVKVWIDEVENDLNTENDTIESSVEIKPGISYPYAMTSESANTDFASSTSGTRNAYWTYNNGWVFVPYQGRTSLLWSNCITLPQGSVRVEFEYQSGNSFTINALTGAFVSSEYVQVGTSGELQSSIDEWAKAHIICSIAEAGPTSLALSANANAQILIRNIQIKDPYEDIIVKKITSPLLTAKLAGETTEISALVENMGKTTQYNIPIHYQINNETIVSETIESLEVGQSVSYTFTHQETWNSPETKNLKIWSSLPNDGDLTNDTVSTAIHVYTARTFPYNMGFNDDSADTAYWASYNPDNDQVYWSTISRAATGLSKEGSGIGYIDSFSGVTHNDWYISPAITIPAGTVRISFYYATTYTTGTSSLKVYMGRTDDPESFQTEICSYPLEDALQYKQGYAKIDIPETGNYYFAFYNDGTGRNVLLDDIRIDTSEDMALLSVSADTESGFNLTESAVTIKFVNHGVSSRSDIPVHYIVNDDNLVSEVYPGPVAAGDTAEYTFSQKADISTIGSYIFKASIKDPADSDKFNDVLSSNELQHYENASMPYLEDFEDQETEKYWRLSSATTANLLIAHNQLGSNSAYSGSGLLACNNQSAADVDAWARSQCIDIQSGEYEFSMFYRTTLNMPSSPTSKISYVQRFKVYLTENPDDLTDALLLYDNDSVLVKVKQYAKLSVPVTIETSGKYYIMVNCYSPKGMGTLFMDRIQLAAPTTAKTTLPYTADFAENESEWYHYNPADNIEQWNVVSSDEETYMQTQYTWYSYSMEAKAIAGMLVAPPVELQAGDSIDVSIDYEIAIDKEASNHGQSIQVYMADKDVPDRYTTCVVTGDTIGSRTTATGGVRIPENGIYYFGVQAVCPQQTSVSTLKLYGFHIEKKEIGTGLSDTDTDKILSFDNRTLRILRKYDRLYLYAGNGTLVGCYSGESHIDLSTRETGIYIVKIIAENQVHTEKIRIK